MTPEQHRLLADLHVTIDRAERECSRIDYGPMTETPLVRIELQRCRALLDRVAEADEPVAVRR